MCIPYEKTLSGMVTTKLWNGLGFEASPDPVGKYVTKKGVWAAEKPVVTPQAPSGPGTPVPHFVSNSLVVR